MIGYNGSSPMAPPKPLGVDGPSKDDKSPNNQASLIGGKPSLQMLKADDSEPLNDVKVFI